MSMASAIPRSTARSRASVPIAASAASSPSTSRTIGSATSPAAKVRPTENRLCVKGRFGFDYIAPPGPPDPAPDPQGRRAQGARRRRSTRPTRSTHFPRGELGRGAGPGRGRVCARSATATAGKALAGFGSAKGSNEEAYLFQKLVRTGFGTNNVDHCTRLCHASSVAALIENDRLGRGHRILHRGQGRRRDHRDRRQPDREPPGRRDLHQAARRKRGKTLIVMDPRGQALKRHATHMLQFKPGTDVALLNALMHVIIEEGLYDRQYIQAHTDGFDALKRASAPVSARGRWPQSAASTPRRSARSRELRDRAARRSSSGAWASASTSTAPTTPAA